MKISMQVHWNSISLLAFLISLAVGTAEAQKPDNPRFILNTRGPAGVTMAIRFSPDSTRLYSAGLDKVVHGWKLLGAQGQLINSAPTQTLRWEFARGKLGQIYAADFSPTAEVMAIAGESTRDPFGDIILYDVANNQILRSLPPYQDIKRGTGHMRPIVSVNFSPSGKFLVSVGLDSNVRIWNVGTGQLVAEAQPGGGKDQFTQPAIFVTESVVAYSERTQTGWRVTLFDLQTGQRTPLPTDHGTEVTAMARGPRGTWASADSLGRVWIYQGLNGQAKNLRTWARIVSSLSFGPQNLLAIGHRLPGGKPNAEKFDPSIVELWDVPAGKMVDLTGTAQRDHLYTATISPDGKLLATHNADNAEIYLYPLRDAQGQLIPQPLRPAKRTVLRGRGIIPWRVSFADKAPPYLISLTTDRPPIGAPEFNNFGVLPTEQTAKVFNLTAPELLQKYPEGLRWKTPDDQAAGWSLQTRTINKDREDVQLSFRGNVVATIPINVPKMGGVISSCWISDGNGFTYAVALGTASRSGVFIYRLPTQARPQVELIRYFRDHQGSVVSLSVSSDGKFLASAAKDQTVKIWSLEDLPNLATSRTMNIWGADFAIQNGQLVIAKVNPAGIIVSRGYFVGDVVASVKTFDINNRIVSLNTPQQMLQVFQDARLPVFQSFLLGITRNGRPVDARGVRIVVPGWEPLMTLFVDRGGEWALWTPVGYYDSSVAEGNELFGWQINLGAGNTPRILRAVELQKEFDRPDLMRRLLAVGSLQGAFNAIAEQAPPDVNNRVKNVAAQVPEVEILEPQASLELQPGQQVRFTARIDYPQGANPNQFTVRGFVNGVPLGTPQLVNRAGAQFASWQTSPTDTLNRFKIKVEEVGVQGVGLFKEDQVAIKAAVESQRFRLHLMSVAVSKYQGGSFQPLSAPVRDAEDLVGSLEGKKGDFYDLQEGQIESLYEENVTRQSVLDLIQKTKVRMKNASPNDVLVIYLGGHGHGKHREYFYVPQSVKSDDEAVLEKEAVAGTEFLVLRDIPCRKILLIDTCHAGNVLQATKNAVSLFKQSEFMVVAATSVNQEAVESAIYDDHGAFTFSLLNGLDGSADGEARDKDKDGSIDLLELVEFVKRDVPRITRSEQTPTATPGDLFRDIELFLVKNDKKEPVTP